MQTKWQSVKESFTDWLIATAFHFVQAMVFFPLIGVEASGLQIIVLQIIFSVVSLLRRYVTRRFFNRRYGSGKVVQGITVNDATTFHFCDTDMEEMEKLIMVRNRTRVSADREEMGRGQRL